MPFVTILLQKNCIAKFRISQAGPGFPVPGKKKRFQQRITVLTEAPILLPTKRKRDKNGYPYLVVPDINK